MSPEITALMRKVRFIRLELGEPRIEIVAEHVLREQLADVEPAIGNEPRRIPDTPHRQRVVVGDEPHGLRAGPVHSPREQHADRLVRETALERIDHQKMPLPLRKVSTSSSPAAGISDRSAWMLSHSHTSSGSTRQWLGWAIISRTRRARWVESGNLPPS